MKKALFVIAAMTLASAASAAPFVWPAKWSADPASAAKTGGELRQSVISEYKTFNPFTTTENGNIPDLMAASTSGLFTQSPEDGSFLPYMADGPAKVSNGNKTFVVNIRQGMKFSDGQEITADDWITTAKIIKDEAVGSNSRDNWFLSDKEVKVKKLGKYQLQFDFPNTTSKSYVYMSYTPWPDHIFAPVYAKSGAEGIKKMWTLNTDPKQIVSPGAWVLSTYRTGERAILSKNPYWGEWNKDSAGKALPYLNSLSFAIVKDVNAQLAALLAGQLDLFTPSTADQLAQIKKAIDAGNLKANLIANIGPQASSQWIVFNWNLSSNPGKQALFRDVRFRRAMSMLADRDSMVKLAYGGFATPTYGSVYPLFTNFIPANTPKYEYNLAQAQKLLAEIGYAKKNSDGYLVNKSGKVLEFNMVTNAGNNQREQLMRIFADTAKKAGVKVNAQPVDFNVLVNQLTSKGADRPFDSILLGLAGGDNIWPFGQNVVPCGTNLHSYNTSGKCLTAQENLMSKLYYQGDAELDQAKRQQIGAQLLKVQSELQPTVYLVGPNYHVAYLDRVGGLYPRPLINAYNLSRAGGISPVLTYIK